MTYGLEIRQNRSTSQNLGHVRTSRSKDKVQGHRRKISFPFRLKVKLRKPVMAQGRLKIRPKFETK